MFGARIMLGAVARGDGNHTYDNPLAEEHGSDVEQGSSSSKYHDHEEGSIKSARSTFSAGVSPDQQQQLLRPSLNPDTGTDTGKMEEGSPIVGRREEGSSIIVRNPLIMDNSTAQHHTVSSSSSGLAPATTHAASAPCSPTGPADDTAASASGPSKPLFSYLRLNTVMRKRVSASGKSVTSRIPKVLLLPILSTLVFGLLLCGILPTMYKAQKDFDKYSAPKAYPANLTVENAVEFEGLNLVGSLLSIDPVDGSLAIWHFELIPGGTLASHVQLGVIDMRPDADLTVMVGGVSETLQAGDAMQDWDVPVRLDVVKPIFYYPFDRYNVTVLLKSFQVILGDKRLNTSNGGVTYVQYFQPVQVNAAISAYKNGWMPTLQVTANPDDSMQVRLSVLFERSTNTQFFSIFLLVLIWLLALTMFVVTMDYTVIHTRDVTYEAPALAVAMLFSLPFIRDVLPDAPPIGVAADVLCFFWAMLLVALSCCILMSALFAQRFRSAKEAKEAHAAAAKHT